jgi:uncharacterized protein DUF2628
MTIYTVHAPPPRAGQTDPERFTFVRDGFYFWAFIFGPLWLLLKQLWLVLLFYVAVAVALQFCLWLIGVPEITRGGVSLLMHLLVGLEAATLKRWTLQLRGWRQLGVVSGTNYEGAERRFFDFWVGQMSRPAAPAAPSQSASPAMRVPQASSEIIGLFPEPQSRQ